MEIREAVRNDSGKISSLVSTLSKKYIAPTCTKEGIEVLLKSMTEESIQRYLNEGYRYFVAEEGECIVGVIGMKNNTEIYHLFVSDSHHGQGVSRRLWELAKSVCLLNGNKGFFTVNSAVNAKGVYIKFGFSPAGGITTNSGIQEIPMNMYC